MSYPTILRTLPRACGEPLATAAFRRSAEDFTVSELIDFEFTGEGDHLCLLLQKNQLNTQEVIQRLESAFAVKAVDIGYFGLKDKRAVACQWFSVHLPGGSAEAASCLAQLEPLGCGISVQRISRHKRKLRIGSHCGNRFSIVLREFDGDSGEFEVRFNHACTVGFPNYFGEQRFGHGAQNLHKALSLFRRGTKRVSRRQKSLYLSAARGFLFNLMLAARVRDNSWLTVHPDDIVMLAGSNSFFPAAGEADMQHRLLQQDIHTSAVLWGAGVELADWENEAIVGHEELVQGLLDAGLKAARRPLRATLNDASLQWLDSSTVQLEFALGPGSYATALLRELCLLDN